MLHTTFRLAKKADALGKYNHLAKKLGGDCSFGLDNPIPLTIILKYNGLVDACSAFRCVLPDETEAGDKLARLFLCDCAEWVMEHHKSTLRHIDSDAHLSISVGMEMKHKLYPPDIGPHQALDLVRRYAIGQATLKELVIVGEIARSISEAAGLAQSTMADTDNYKASRSATAIAEVWIAVDNAVRGNIWDGPAYRKIPRRWQSSHLKEMLEGSYIKIPGTKS